MDAFLLRLTYALVLIYNLIFFIGKYVGTPSFVVRGYEFIDTHYFYFALLELMGVGAIFVDLIAKYETKPVLRRRISLFLGALFLMAFLAKVFIEWFHSALLTD